MMPVLNLYYCVVESSWLDYNQHMNVAYYSLAFDQASEALVKDFGMGLAYAESTQNSWMVLEAHLTYQNEARLGERLRIESRIFDYNSKLVHLYQEMYRDDVLLATEEQMMLHVSLETRRAKPFPPDIFLQLEALHARHHRLAPPTAIGRRIGIKR